MGAEVWWEGGTHPVEFVGRRRGDSRGGFGESLCFAHGGARAEWVSAELRGENKCAKNKKPKIPKNKFWQIHQKLRKGPRTPSASQTLKYVL
jgi:hypothetical protein